MRWWCPCRHRVRGVRARYEVSHSLSVKLKDRKVHIPHDRFRIAELQNCVADTNQDRSNKLSSCQKSACESAQRSHCRLVRDAIDVTPCLMTSLSPTPYAPSVSLLPNGMTSPSTPRYPSLRSLHARRHRNQLGPEIN